MANWRGLGRGVVAAWLVAGTMTAARGQTGPASVPATQGVPPAYWSFAPTPPMGWNSYDSFADSVTEEEVLANARYMKEKLASHGWQYVVVDFRWYDANPTADDRDLIKKRWNTPVEMDEFGRLQPAPNRFPSAAGGKGFGPLAEQIHGMGLKFGIHLMRGIPRMAVKANTPIEGGNGMRAWDASSFNTCVWCADMFGADVTRPAGQAWYDSIFRQYAAWGVDYVKVDDLSVPYSAGEVAAIRKAIDACGRPIVFSTSPGETPVRMAAHVAAHANLWRISGDFWDDWKKLDHQFDLIGAWQGKGGPGHWPDADMLPLGRVAVREPLDGPPHQTHFTHDEQITMMSLWALAPSPLMMGGNLPDNDERTEQLLTNDEMLAIDQDPAGHTAVRNRGQGGVETWSKVLGNGDVAVGLFNRGAEATRVTLRKGDVGLAGRVGVRDVWAKQDVGVLEEERGFDVPGHGAVLLRLVGSRG